MVHPVIPADKLPVLVVTTQNVIVARFRQTSLYTFALEYAANHGALEDDARAAAEDLCGALTQPDILPCPDDLADRAVWALE